VNQLLRMAAGLSISVMGACAQDFLFAQEEAMAKMSMQLAGSVMGPTVKGAPYSGDEINSSTQVLADGTRIHRENKTTVYRDSEGRVRRESPEQITIMDPVAGVSYFLNPKTMTAQKAPVMANYRTFRFGGDGGPVSVTRSESTLTMITRDGETSMAINGNPVDPKQVAEAIARAKEHGGPVVVAGSAIAEKMDADKAAAAALAESKLRAEKTAAVAAGGIAYEARYTARGKSEDLGKMTIEGLEAEGKRTTSTIETGAIGNDRPIQVVTERWYSPELQTVVSTRNTDPRMGEMSFQLTNVHRGEPGAYLFQIPSGYTVSERK